MPIVYIIINDKIITFFIVLGLYRKHEKRQQIAMRYTIKASSSRIILCSTITGKDKIIVYFKYLFQKTGKLDILTFSVKN